MTHFLQQSPASQRFYSLPRTAPPVEEQVFKQVSLGRRSHSTHNAVLTFYLMCMCLCRVHARAHQIPMGLELQGLWATVWVLGPELAFCRSSKHPPLSQLASPQQVFLWLPLEVKTAEFYGRRLLISPMADVIFFFPTWTPFLLLFFPIDYVVMFIS